MRTLPGPLEAIDVRPSRWTAHYGVVFLWFGVLKFFPGVSLVILATLECAIGFGLISGKLMRLTLLLLASQSLAADRARKLEDREEQKMPDPAQKTRFLPPTPVGAGSNPPREPPRTATDPAPGTGV